MRWRKGVVHGAGLACRIGCARCAGPAGRPRWNVLEGQKYCSPRKSVRTVGPEGRIDANWGTVVPVS
jgi:hypothetical protein